jgi:hypothetical protein
MFNESLPPFSPRWHWSNPGGGRYDRHFHGPPNHSTIWARQTQRVRQRARVGTGARRFRRNRLLRARTDGNDNGESRVTNDLVGDRSVLIEYIPAFTESTRESQPRCASGRS